MSRPKVVVLATGGTIAGSAADGAATTGYRAGAVGVEALLGAVPQLTAYAEVTGEQVAAVDSKDITEALWLRLAERCNALLAEPEVAGIVITHGTDTMEETAYFLHLTVHSEKPVVLTGAMRPATALSADGPMNLLNAVRLAVSPEARGQGVLVCMNDEIHSARYVTKGHTISAGTFHSPGTGALGHMQDGRPVFYMRAERRHTLNSEFSAEGIASLPYVKIIYGHAADDALFVEAAVQAGASGLVYAGLGNGSIPKPVAEALARAVQKGIAVVRSTRCEAGAVIAAEPSYRDASFLEGDSLPPQKCRILLQLALLKERSLPELQNMFHVY